MENTHAPAPIAGYTPLSSSTVAAVNENKMLEERVLRRLDALLYEPGIVSQRWLSIARTHIEQGFMAMNRAIMNPQRIYLPEDATPGPGEAPTA